MEQRYEASQARALARPSVKLLGAAVLAPLAYSPHPGEHTDQARRLLEEVEAKAKGSAAQPEESPSAG